MKYAVLANLTFDTPAKQDQMSQAIKDKIVGKLTWGNVVVSQSISPEGQPNNNVEVRFDNRADMDELYELIKDRMERIPVLKGQVSKHDCPHDIGGSPCQISEEFIKE